MTIAVAIPHTPWVEARAASMASLRAATSVEADRYTEFTERMPNMRWADELWSWGLETGEDHLLQLQDDVVVAPNFWPALRAMLEAVPNHIIALHAPHPAGPRLALEGRRWYTTADGLIGVAYIIPRDILEEFGRWRVEGLRRGYEQRLTEDTLIDLFAMSTGRRIWHPIPCITQHETEIESTYANDAHPYRRASVTWEDGDVVGFSAADLERPSFWTPSSVVADLGRFYSGTHHLARRWVKSWTPEMHEKAEEDECPEELRRWLR